MISEHFLFQAIEKEQNFRISLEKKIETTLGKSLKKDKLLFLIWA